LRSQHSLVEYWAIWLSAEARKVEAIQAIVERVGYDGTEREPAMARSGQPSSNHPNVNSQRFRRILPPRYLGQLSSRQPSAGSIGAIVGPCVEGDRCAWGGLANGVNDDFE
jgi:hypothetical protein